MASWWASIYISRWPNSRRFTCVITAPSQLFKLEKVRFEIYMYTYITMTNKSVKTSYLCQYMSVCLVFEIGLIGRDSHLDQSEAYDIS